MSRTRRQRKRKKRNDAVRAEQRAIKLRHQVEMIRVSSPRCRTSAALESRVVAAGNDMRDALGYALRGVKR